MDNKKKMIMRVPAALLALLLLLTGACAAELVPVGRAVGIELSCDGVLVAGLSEVETENGMVSPSAYAGLEAGDVIVMLDGEKVASAEDFLAAAEKFCGERVAVTLRRGGRLIQYAVEPAECSGGGWKLGLMLRDGVSGIGTMTFYDPATGLYGALGHGVSDSDTGVLLPLGEGFITSASVADVKKGASGEPGELHGCFDEGRRLGVIALNTNCGIFGTAEEPPEGETMSTAPLAEVRAGEAKILAQVLGGETRSYAVEVSRVYRGGEERLLVTVTDPQLLELTGGIVQGMSGAPIIQDGRLIGAVTHVLLSDPTRGYAIGIEDMLKAAPANEKAA